MGRLGSVLPSWQRSSREKIRRIFEKTNNYRNLAAVELQNQGGEAGLVVFSEVIVLYEKGGNRVEFFRISGIWAEKLAVRSLVFDDFEKNLVVVQAPDCFAVVSYGAGREKMGVEVAVGAAPSQFRFFLQKFDRFPGVPVGGVADLGKTVEF